MIDGVQGLVNFEGYYLDGEDVYSPREPVYQAHKVADLEAEAKYTENRTMIRLTARYQIKSVSFPFLFSSPTLTCPRHWHCIAEMP